MKNLQDIISSLLDVVRIQVMDSTVASEDKRSSYEWWIEESKKTSSEDIQRISDRKMHPGKIHLFEYNPIHKDRLSYWDQKPIVLYLGATKTNNGYLQHGFNISWWPPEARMWLIEKIQKAHQGGYDQMRNSSSKAAVSQSKVILNMYKLKYNLDQYGLSFALRSYYANRMTSHLYVVSYSHWDKALSLDTPKEFPKVYGDQPIRSIYEDFNEYVRIQRANRNRYLRNLEQATKSKKYDLIY